MFNISKIYKPIIGMVHLLPLPGSPDFDGNLDRVYKRAKEDAIALKNGGIDAVIVENAGDIPHEIPDSINCATTTVMAIIAKEIRDLAGLPVGISCSTNAVKEDLAIAIASGATFIRSTSWTTGYFSSIGYVKPQASIGLRYRDSIKGNHIKIMADVQVKNGSHLFASDKTIVEHCSDIKSNKADYIVITGNTTGVEPNFDEMKLIKDKCKLPLLVGSGATIENIEKFLNYCDGVIIGTYFKEARQMCEPVIEDKVRQFMDVVNRYRSKN